MTSFGSAPVFGADGIAWFTSPESGVVWCVLRFEEYMEELMDDEEQFFWRSYQPF